MPAVLVSLGLHAAGAWLLSLVVTSAWSPQVATSESGATSIALQASFASSAAVPPVEFQATETRSRDSAEATREPDELTTPPTDAPRRRAAEGHPPVLAALPRLEGTDPGSERIRRRRGPVR